MMKQRRQSGWEFAADLIDPQWRTRYSSAQEFLANASTDPVAQLNLQRRDWARRRQALNLEKDEAPIVDELARSGVKVESFWDLLKSDALEDDVVAILVSHLSKPHLPRTVEGLARVLMGSKDKRRAFTALVATLKAHVDGRTPLEREDLRWIIGVAIGHLADREAVRTLRELVVEPLAQDARAGLLEGLRRLRIAGAMPVAIELLQAPELIVTGAAISFLGALGDTAVLPHLEKKLESSAEPDVRRAVERAIERVRKRSISGLARRPRKTKNGAALKSTRSR